MADPGHRRASGPSRTRRKERRSPPERWEGSTSEARPPAFGPEPPLRPARALHAHPAQAALARRARRRPAHPDALQHPDPLLLVHSEGHPAGLAALGAPHGRRRAGRRPRDPAPEQPAERWVAAPCAPRASRYSSCCCTSQQSQVLLAASRDLTNHVSPARGVLWGL